MPWFEIRRDLGGAGIVALSANFPLYGDMSGRVMSVAAGFGPVQEIYSIDECFIGLHGMRGDMTARTEAVRQRIRQWVGIPCGIGIGRTKTLAKLANHVAKTADRKPGSYPAELAHVCNLEALPAVGRDAVLQATDLGEIWGVGRRIGEQLRALGVSTALDVARMDPATVRRRWSIVLERTVRELQGVACIELGTEPALRKEIACTRSFGQPVRTLRDLVELMAERGLSLAHTTIMRWVQRYAPEFIERWNRFGRPAGHSWRVDETYLKVRGQWRYLYRAVDRAGKTVDFHLSAKRDVAAAKAFFAKAVKSQGAPQTITLGGYAAWHRAVRELKADGVLPKHTKVRSSKFLNNLIEQDHRAVKQRSAPMLGFKRFRTAAITVAGIELLHRIRKGQFALGRLGVQGRAAPVVWDAVLRA